LKSVRLLPVVIFAALALLVFKGIGLVTNGGYVLTGTTQVVAEESVDPSASSDPPAAVDPTMTDSNAVMDDTAPTLQTKVDAPPEGAPSGEPGSSSGASSTAAAEPSASSSAVAELSSSTAASSSTAPPAAAATTCPDTGAAPSAPSSAPPAGGHDLNDAIGTALATKGCPSVTPPVNAEGDALPMTKDGTGKMVPLDTAEGDNSQAALLQRLGQRRDELDKREADLAMRSQLVEAAEKKLDDKTKELADLQAKIDALVDQKQAAEDANFKAIVSMYETMKPKDAAKIFDTLDINVLIKVAQAMNPRKMSPILAAMDPKPAESLTTAFALNNTPSPTANGGGGLAALPQIVGQ
jgi:flagellar motility protein MotE (MotC chaperone)